MELTVKWHDNLILFMFLVAHDEIRAIDHTMSIISKVIPTFNSMFVESHDVVSIDRLW